MPALTLPATFTNSFWSQDYRRGIETLYTKLEQGVAEDDEIVAFIRARAVAENALASALIASQSTGAKGKGFNADEGASLLMAFRGLQAESAAQGEAHRTVAKELKELVADPFAEWADGHKERIYGSRNAVIDGWIKSYELAEGDVDKLKHQYLAKVRRADEAEDDAKFAPNNELAPDNYTSSPRLAPRDRVSQPQRTASVSERIAQRFKELQRKAVNGASGRSSTDQESKGDTHSTSGSVSTVIFEDKAVTSEPDGHPESPASSEKNTEKPLPPVDKGKGKEVETLASPPPMSQALPPPKVDLRPASPMPPPPPPPILLAGLALPPVAVSDLLKRAAADMNLRPIKVPIIGEYKDCFSGEEFVVWLVDNVQGFGGSLDRAEDAAKDLTERDGVLRRVGEFGNAFENNDEAYYQFRPKAFNLEAEYYKHEQRDSVTSPIVNLSPMADNLVKRSNNFVNIVSKAINDRHAEPFHIRARQEANAADTAYRSAVRKLDRQRLALEERLEETLKTLQKWEMDRLRAVKTVLLQYQGTLANLPNSLQSSIDRSSTLIASYQPDSDLRALIERYRTGPFKPVAHVYESLTHEECDVYFGIDLRRWAEGSWDSLRSDAPPKDNIPEVLTALLGALNAAYPKLSSDSEKRKTWIYEVPLSAVHHLRESLNSVPSGHPFPPDLITKYDAPVIASTVKLWALELDPPLGTWEGWDDFRRLYPSVGSKSEETNEQQHIENLQAALLRLPRIHLLVLEAIFGHIKSLIDSTTTEEDNEVYMTKLALSMGRNILRPKVENEISIQDRHPTSLFIDLLKHFDAVLPPTIARKKRESDRKIPLRKRTRPVDMRMSRSRLSVTNVDTREILEEQMVARNPSMRPPSRAGSPNPSGRHSRAPSREARDGREARLSVPDAEAIAPPPDQKAEEANMVDVVIPVPDASPVPSPAFAPRVPAPEDPNAPPPMPAVFKEPPPEKDDIAPPPMPRFVEPPPEVDDTPSVSLGIESSTNNSNNSAPVGVSPPTPTSLSARSRSPPSGTASPSPISPTERFAAASGTGAGAGANLARSGSGESSRLRGPRGARTAGGRRPSGSSTASTGARNTNNASSLHRSAAVSPPRTSGLQRSANRLSYSGGSRSGSPAPSSSDYESRKKVNRTSAGAFS
ncbi:RGA8 [Sanghuangporus vaninii]